MFSWLTGSGDNTVEKPTEKVRDVMVEARVVKDFYDRMIDMCSQKCKATSIDTDDELGRDNCMDRCLLKYEETKKIVEKELESL